MSQPQKQRFEQQNPSVISCECGHIIYDGEVIRSRCVKIDPPQALCRCKKWVPMPIQRKTA